MFDFIIIGAGVTGLAADRLLRSEGFETLVLERSCLTGGIARPRSVYGMPYHITGGHCLNSKNQRVLDFIFEVYPEELFNKIKRVAKIEFDEFTINYPVELNVKQIFEKNQELAINIVESFLSAPRSTVGNETLEGFFLNNFGRALTDFYFRPYNDKIWGRSIRDMSSDWVTGKLPRTSVKQFVESLFRNVDDLMPHSTFLYPRTGSQGDFLDALGAESPIWLEYPVERIEYAPSGWWEINGELRSKSIISTVPLDVLPRLTNQFFPSLKNEANQLEVNKTTTMFWKTEKTDATWTYIPGKDNPFHRYIHIDNFVGSKQGFAISECVGEVRHDDLIEFGEKSNFLLESLDYHVSERSYVVFNEKRSKTVRSILDFFERKNLFSLGRFGQWEYFNMDVCIEEAMKLVSRIKQK